MLEDDVIEFVYGEVACREESTFKASVWVRENVGREEEISGVVDVGCVGEHGEIDRIICAVGSDCIDELSRFRVIDGAHCGIEGVNPSCFPEWGAFD